MIIMKMKMMMIMIMMMVLVASGVAYEDAHDHYYVHATGDAC